MVDAVSSISDSIAASSSKKVSGDASEFLAFLGGQFSANSVEGAKPKTAETELKREVQDVDGVFAAPTPVSLIPTHTQTGQQTALQSGTSSSVLEAAIQQQTSNRNGQAPADNGAQGADPDANASEPDAALDQLAKKASDALKATSQNPTGANTSEGGQKPQASASTQTTEQAAAKNAPTNPSSASAQSNQASAQAQVQAQAQAAAARNAQSEAFDEATADEASELELAANRKAGNTDNGAQNVRAENNRSTVQPVSASANSNTTQPNLAQNQAGSNALSTDSFASDLAVTDALGDVESTETTATTTTSTTRTADLPPTLRNASSVAQQAWSNLIHRSNGTSQRFEIHLDPAELGEIDVSIEISKDSKARVVLAVSNPEALSELTRSAKSLENALNDSGFDLSEGGLSFELAKDGKGSFTFSEDTQNQNEHAGKSSGGNANAQTDGLTETPTSYAVTPELTVWNRVRVNLTA